MHRGLVKACVVCVRVLQKRVLAAAGPYSSRDGLKAFTVTKLRKQARHTFSLWQCSQLLQLDDRDVYCASSVLVSPHSQLQRARHTVKARRRQVEQQKDTVSLYHPLCNTAASTLPLTARTQDQQPHHQQRGHTMNCRDVSRSLARRSLHPRKHVTATRPQSLVHLVPLHSL